MDFNPRCTIEAVAENSFMIRVSSADRPRDAQSMSSATQTLNVGEQKAVTEFIRQLNVIIHTEMQGLLWNCVPAYQSILIVYDILAIDDHAVAIKLHDCIEKVLSQFHSQKKHESRSEIHTELKYLPVLYNLEMGYDLERIAKSAGLDVATVIELHHSPIYQVFCTGFIPGFAYCGFVDQRLATPRLASPRTSVPKGSVAIADRQTGVYPSESPGGWNIIGRTPLNLFDISDKANLLPASPELENDIVYLHMGDRIKFLPINESQFEQIQSRGFAKNWLPDDALNDIN